MCRVLEGWKNNNRHNWFSEANDGVAFATTDASGNKKKNKNKKVTCFKCKKQGHYANECEEVSDNYDESTKEKKSTRKKGSNFMNHGQGNKRKETRMKTMAVLVTRKEKVLMTKITSSPSCNMTCPALFKTRQQFQRRGFCLTVSQR